MHPKLLCSVCVTACACEGWDLRAVCMLTMNVPGSGSLRILAAIKRRPAVSPSAYGTECRWPWEKAAFQNAANAHAQAPQQPLPSMPSGHLPSLTLYPVCLRVGSPTPLSAVESEALLPPPPYHLLCSLSGSTRLKVSRMQVRLPRQTMTLPSA